MQSIGEFEYTQSDLIGHGAFALVFRGRRKKTHEPVAIKQIALKAVPGKLSSIRQKEITILKQLKHSNIVRLHDYLETKSDIFLIMEYCNGGDMGDYLQAKKTLSEDSIRHLARHIAEALRAIHRLDIIHRDVKPQNLLLSYPLPSSRRERAFRDATIKLADFGFARYLTGADLAATLCGSPLYMAPEILLGQRYDSKADLWSVGTILFQCLNGTAPFLATNPHALRKRYEKERLIPRIPEGASKHLGELLFSLLKKNSRERLSHDDFYGHPFLRDPSPHATAVLMEQPSQHAKSSPVPIRRQTAAPSPFSTSPRHHTPPQHRGSLENSSAPPSLHTAGSGSSIQYRSRSPNSDSTDHGFIIVDYPSSGSRRYSLSPHSASPGSYSSLGRTPSSPAGSLTRLTSLTTPFYFTRPLPPDQLQLGAASSSHVQNPATSPSLSRFSSRRRSSEPITAPLSHTPPFSRLIQCGQTYNNSPLSSSPRSISPQILYQRKSNSPSPYSTPPSSLPSNSPITSGFLGGTRPPHSHGMRYSLTPHGSGTKLSSLAELAENEPHSPVHRRDPRLPACDNFITPSQILHSDDEEEENFPLSLSLNSSYDSGEMDNQEGKTRGTRVESPSDSKPLSFEATTAGRNGSRLPRRAWSFSHGKTRPRPSWESGQTRNRSTSFTDHDCTPTEKRTYSFDIPPPSPTPTITYLNVPFSFQGLGAAQTPAKLMSQSSGAPLRVPSSLSSAQPAFAEEDEDGCFAQLSQSMVLARELLEMAKARQGPILLLSTDLSDSGIASRVQRCSEQLVLCAKAVRVLESGLRQCEIGMAAQNLDPSARLMEAEAEARGLQDTCLERAKQIKELLSQCMRERRLTQPVVVSAERLLVSEALDMCKATVLNERSGDSKECIKRYKRAKLIFQQLHLDAVTPQDQAVLQKYIHLVQKRIQHLSKQ